jgi:hypothetical protein
MTLPSESSIAPVCSVESDDSTGITISEEAIISRFVAEELDRSTQ